MKGNFAMISALPGCAIGLVVALGMSYVDWRHNPAGIFHIEHGTDWGTVLDTAISWFLPVAFVATALSIAVLSWRARPER